MKKITNSNSKVAYFGALCLAVATSLAILQDGEKLSIAFGSFMTLFFFGVGLICSAIENKNK